MKTPRALAFALVRAALLSAALAVVVAPSVRADLPNRIPDRDYWKLVEDLSEPNGFFRSENLVSNEDTFQVVIPRVLTFVKPGGVYLGVGPDQNFTYIVALQPRIAFIVDIRRGNLQEHLMYKALLELSLDRADFLSRLFSRPRPPGIGPASTADDLFNAYATVEPSQNLFNDTRVAIGDLLMRKHGFPLSAEDIAGIDYVLGSFRSGGPYLSYAGIAVPPVGPAAYAPRGSRYPTYQDLQTATDGEGLNRAYLGTEENYRTLSGSRSGTFWCRSSGTSQVRRRCARWVTTSGRGAPR
jgi:hypothetical protein